MTKPDTETRIWSPALQEVRVADPAPDGKTRITGLAVPYGQTSEDLGKFREMFSPGAFSGTINENHDVFADVEHQATRKIGRRQNGTLELWDAADGLRVTITLPDTSVGKDTAEEVRAGLLDGMSIAFTDAVSEWVGKGADTLRKITKATLRAVTLTSFPAYRQTVGTLALRSLEEHEKQQADGEAPATPPDVLTRWVDVELADARS